MPMEIAIDIESFYPVAAVTAAHVALYYVFLALQIFAKYSTQRDIGKGWHRFDHRPRLWQFGDRTFGNMHEQAVPFYASLWTHAFVVDPEVSATLGAVYVAFRALYPFLWASMGRKTPLIVVSTFTGYIVILGFAASTLLRTAFDVGSESAWLHTASGVLCLGLALLVAVAVVGLGIGAMVKPFFKNEKTEKST